NVATAARGTADVGRTRVLVVAVPDRSDADAATARLADRAVVVIVANATLRDRSVLAAARVVAGVGRAGVAVVAALCRARADSVLADVGLRADAAIVALRIVGQLRIHAQPGRGLADADVVTLVGGGTFLRCVHATGCVRGHVRRAADIGGAGVRVVTVRIRLAG